MTKKTKSKAIGYKMKPSESKKPRKTVKELELCLEAMKVQRDYWFSERQHLMDIVDSCISLPWPLRDWHLIKARRMYQTALYHRITNWLNKLTGYGNV